MRKKVSFFAIVAWAVAFIVMAGFVLESSSLGKTVASGNYGSWNSGPTAAAGESWLNHLHRTFDETSMGKTGQLGPPSAMAAEEFARWQMRLAPEAADEPVTLHGSDLYRMNCRGCHGEGGQGAPPEINSVINPVRATSVAAIMERMNTAGMEMSRTDAAKLAQQSNAMLLERLHHGGQDMPAFPHLREAEVDSLIAYLRQLAGVRGAQEEQVAVQESRVRVGEHIVKSTCHICHSAAGPNPNPRQLYAGAIPPLNTLALRTSRAEFIRKVTHGSPVIMGAPPQLYRGRMPVFYYLSEEEAADVYLYLARYPPYQWATIDPSPNPSLTAATSQPDQGTLDPEPPVAGAAFTSNAGRADDRAASSVGDRKFAALPVLAGFIATALLGLGLVFTVYELMRLSRTSRSRDWAVDRMHVQASAAAAECPECGNERVDHELVA